jgi:hypothetical protein
MPPCVPVKHVKISAAVAAVMMQVGLLMGQQRQDLAALEKKKNIDRSNSQGYSTQRIYSLAQ